MSSWARVVLLVTILSWPVSSADPRRPAPAGPEAPFVASGDVTPPSALARDEDVLHVLGESLQSGGSGRRGDGAAAGAAAREDMRRGWGAAANGVARSASRSSPTGIMGGDNSDLASRASTGGGGSTAVAPLGRINSLNSDAKKNVVTTLGGLTHFDVDVVKRRRGEGRHIRGELQNVKSVPASDVDSPAPTVFVVVAISALICAVVSLFAA